MPRRMGASSAGALSGDSAATPALQPAGSAAPAPATPNAPQARATSSSPIGESLRRRCRRPRGRRISLRLPAPPGVGLLPTPALPSSRGSPRRPRAAPATGPHSPRFPCAGGRGVAPCRRLCCLRSQAGGSASASGHPPSSGRGVRGSNAPRPLLLGCAPSGDQDRGCGPVAPVPLWIVHGVGAGGKVNSFWVVAALTFFFSRRVTAPGCYVCFRVFSPPPSPAMAWRWPCSALVGSPSAGHHCWCSRRGRQPPDRNSSARALTRVPQGRTMAHLGNRRSSVLRLLLSARPGRSGRPPRVPRCLPPSTPTVASHLWLWCAEGANPPRHPLLIAPAGKIPYSPALLLAPPPTPPFLPLCCPLLR